jgi:hypothetical protein
VRKFVDARKCAAHCPPCGGCPVAAQCAYQQSSAV